MIPIVLTTNNGLGKHVKFNIFDASITVICFLSSKSFKYLALLGYPDNMLKKKTNEASFGTPKNLLKIFLNISLMKSTKPIFINKEDIIKKGNNDGNKFSFHNVKLKLTALPILFEYKKIAIRNVRIDINVKNDINLRISTSINVIIKLGEKEMKKLLNEITKLIKEDYKFILLIIIFTIIITMPVPYYIITGGGILNINNRVTIENQHDIDGSFNFSYVQELKGTTITYVYGKLFNKELIKKDSIKYDNETTKDYEMRDKMYLYESVANATYVAYTLAGKEIDVIDTKIKILYVDGKANTNLKTGDTIINVDDVRINNLNEYREIVSNKKDGESIKLLVERNKKELNCYAKLYQLNDQVITGIYAYEDKTYRTNPKISFDFNARESGPSGGLMLALNIYDKLEEESITKGRKIAGTGAIDELGNVLEIGGVEYKLPGAVKAGCDIFIVPTGENYQEAIKLQEKENYNIIIIEAKNVEQVINELKDK